MADDEQLAERKKAFLCAYAEICKRYDLEIEPSGLEGCELVEQDYARSPVEVMVVSLCSYFGVK